jgi:hypothetical protein
MATPYVPFNGVTDVPNCVALGNEGDRGGKAPQSTRSLAYYWLLTNFLSFLWGIPTLTTGQRPAGSLGGSHLPNLA